MNRIIPGNVLIEAVTVTFRNLDSVARAAFIPFVFGIAMSVVLLAFRVQFDLDQGFGGIGAAVVVGNLVNVVLTMPFFTKWHRFVLLGPEKGAVPMGWVWGTKEWAYAGYTLLIAVILGGLGLVPALLAGGGAAAGSSQLTAGVLGLAGLIAAVWFSLRACFVYPASAIGRPTGLGVSFGQTAGNAGPLIGVYIVIAALTILVILVVSAVYAVVKDVLFLALVMKFVMEVLNFLIGAVVAGATAIAYAKATGFDPNAQ